MTTKRTGKRAATAAPSGKPEDATGVEEAPWAIPPLPTAVLDYLQDSKELRSAPGLIARLSDAFEIYSATNPSNFKAPAEEVAGLKRARAAIRVLQAEMRELSEAALAEMNAQPFGARQDIFESWWRGRKRDLSELDGQLQRVVAVVERRKGSKSKKPSLEARDRLLRTVFECLPGNPDDPRRRDVAADLLRAAGIPVPADTTALGKLIAKAAPAS